MTRDEVVRKFYKTLACSPASHQVNGFDWCGGMVDALIAIGVLEVDEPIDNPMVALASAMTSARDEGSGALTAVRVSAFLDQYGFKVVKK